MLDSRVVGALACQKNSYLRTLDAEVVSCEKLDKGKDDPGKDDLWRIVFSDSVLFPEGGGQPTDYGSVVTLGNDSAEHVPIRGVYREGLACVYHSPQALIPGDRVRQTVDFTRRWDHMQQHTGQHLLSAVIDDMHKDMPTLGWAMGADGKPNYIDLPRMPSAQELSAISERCNELIQKNLTIAVHSEDDGKSLHDYNAEKGVMRTVNIGELDSNPCCGTHLQQTSHIGLIILLSVQKTHGKNSRLSFLAGDRAMKLATNSVGAIVSMASQMSLAPNPQDVQEAVDRSKAAAAAAKKREKSLLERVATLEADRVKVLLQSGKSAWVYDAVQGKELAAMVIRKIKDVTSHCENCCVVIAGGSEKSDGHLMAVGASDAVEDLVKELERNGIEAKGNGKAGQWQGKVAEWRKGQLDLLERLVTCK